MASISDVILFVSSTSSACVPCMQFVSQSGMPVRMVRLDTAETRNAVKMGGYFQIQSVPSLAVMYSGRDMQMFVGQEKIIGWLQQMAAKMNSPPIGRQGQEPGTNLENTSTSISTPVDVDVQEEPRRRRKKSRKKKKKSRSKSTSLYGKKKKKKPVEFEESSEEESSEEIEIEYIQTDQEPPPTQGLMVGPHHTKKHGMGSVMEIAKQMEKERKSSLGYDESKLPRT